MSSGIELQTVLSVLAADFCCQPRDFLEPGVVITEAHERPGRRRFPLRAKTLRVATLGAGVVVSCSRKDSLLFNLGNQHRLPASGDGPWIPHDVGGTVRKVAAGFWSTIVIAQPTPSPTRAHPPTMLSHDPCASHHCPSSTARTPRPALR